MNPFMMSNIFFGPMGMSISPMCCGGVNMPYYGNNDMCTFMNFPIFRNIGSDYLLDPRLAMMQTQQSIMNGGSLFGNNFLPLFNNFPGVSMSPMMSPWWNPSRQPETEEEKKKREEKETEAKKPEAQKAESLKKSFDNIKKLAESHKGFVNLDESIIKKADEAMKKETAAEQLKAMKEVMALIPEDIIRKSVMADEEVVKRLKEAGYNFNYKNNKYSLADKSIEEQVDINQVRSDIISKKNYDKNGLGSFAALASAGEPSILALISQWNNTQDEKGILRFIAKNIPTEEAPLKVLKNMIVPQIIDALIKKADTDYRGCEKIKADKNKLEKAKDELTKNFNAANLNKVSDAFEALYARLRMQEAVKVRDYIVNNNDFQKLNEVKDGIISNDIVVAETFANLKEEGITNPPAEDKLDKIETVTTITIGDEGVIDADKKYEGKPQKLLDEHLAKDNRYLTKVGNSNVYQTKSIDDKGKGIKYYTVSNNKLVECNKEGKVANNAAAVTSKYIEKYDETLTEIINAISRGALVPCTDFATAKLPYPVFKSTAKNEYYALIGNTFGKIKNCTGLSEDKTNKKIHAAGTKKTLDKLTEADLEVVNASDIKSKAEIEEAKKEEKNKSVQQKIDKIQEQSFNSITEAQEQASKLGYKKSVLDDYFVMDAAGKKYFFRYEDGKLVLQEGVTGIKSNGQIKQNGVWTAAKTDLTPSDLGLELRRRLNGDTSSSDYDKIDQILNKFASYTKSDDIIEFIEAYTEQMKKDETIWRWNDRLCAQISSENDYGKERKAKALQIIAKQIKRVMEENHIQLGGYGKTSEEYEDMKFYAESTNSDSESWRKDGNRFMGMNWFGKGWSFWNSSRTGAANHMDDIIDRLITDYNEKVKDNDNQLDQET